MITWLKRVRGALVVALLWAVAWALAGLLIGIAEHRRQFEELSVVRFAGWGALGGLLLSMIPAMAVLFGSATVVEGAQTLWPLTLILAVPLTSLSAASASGSLWLARRSERTGDGRLANGRAPEFLTQADS